MIPSRVASIGLALGIAAASFAPAGAADPFEIPAVFPLTGGFAFSGNASKASLLASSSGPKPRSRRTRQPWARRRLRRRSGRNAVLWSIGRLHP